MPFDFLKITASEGHFPVQIYVFPVTLHPRPYDVISGNESYLSLMNVTH